MGPGVVTREVLAELIRDAVREELRPVREDIRSLQQKLDHAFTQDRSRRRYADAQLLSRAEAARRLGCGKAKVKRLIDAGHLRVLPHGKHGRVPADDVEKLASTTGLPPDGVQAKAPKRTGARPAPPASFSVAEEVRKARAIRVSLP